MSKIEILSSTSQLNTLLSKNTVVVIDFHATWCGPCKVIAPTFASLATAHSTPSKIAFAKVDVDAAQPIASQYSVRAMPTFVILKNRAEVARVQGADKAALTAAVEKHCRDVKRAVGYGGKGYTLGSEMPAGGKKKVYVRNAEVVEGVPWGPWVWGGLTMAASTVGLYVVSLLSLDPVKAAEESRFNQGKQEGGRPVGRTLGM